VNHEAKTEQAIRASSVSVRFGGVKALTDVSLTIPAGRVTGLIGPNGSGKSTMVNVITGMVRPTAGQVTLDGTDVLSSGASARPRHGLVRTFQTPRVKGASSVLDNVLIGSYAKEHTGIPGAIFGSPRSRREKRAAREHADQLIERFGLQAFAMRPAAAAPIWALRSMEIARALMADPRYLLLDEPAAGTDDEAKARLMATVKELGSAGIGVLMIEHHFNLVVEVCDDVVVLNKGQLLATGTPAEITTHPEVMSVYLGTEVTRCTEVTR
jgi:ABC-type branched-subunit amino acid transport system ATPase component